MVKRNTMEDRQRSPVLPLALLLLSLGACSTEQIGPDNVLISYGQPGPGQGAFLAAYASTSASYQEDQTRRLSMNWNPPIYNIMMDGKLLAEEEGVAGSTVPQLLPISLSEWGIAGGYVDGGSHHFAMLVPGKAPIYQGDGESMPGGMLRLFVFGAADAQQGRFVFVPDAPSPGNEHITVINLMCSGQAIEVVSCTDATTCTPISAALGLGDLFQTEVPAVVSADGFASLTATGAGIGYRFVPSASFPDPAINALYVGLQGAANRVPGSNDLPEEIFVAAPFFMSDQGQILAGFN
jgi:hypothetical protein